MNKFLFLLRRLVLLIAPSLGGTLAAQTIYQPQVVTAGEVNEDPFYHNGMVQVAGFVGSGSRVAEGIIATAGHVFLDEASNDWFQANVLSYYPRRMNSAFPPGSLEQRYLPLGFTRFASYAARVARENSPDSSTLDTFNLDIAFAYFNNFVIQEGFRSYAEVIVKDEESISLQRHDGRQKLLVGYPQDDDAIPATAQGFMHRTGPADFEAYWSGSHTSASTWRDSEQFWVSTYDLPDVRSYSGNSGGPYYVRTDQNTWAMVAILVGGGVDSGALLRGIDEEAWALVEAAQDIINSSTLRRVRNLQATAVQRTSVTLSWADRSSAEAGTSVYRRDTGPWIKIADLNPNATSFTDTTVHPGRVYSYEVQPFDALGNRTARSNRIRVQTLGSNTPLAVALNQRRLNLRNTGAANWHVDRANRLRAGQIVGMEISGLQLSILGPGTLTFEWGVSCEVNDDDYNRGRDIYDALYLQLNGQRVTEGNRPRFLSGEVARRSETLQLPAGPQRVVWSYEKDPYASAGEDSAFLYSLQWSPDPVNGYPIFGAYAFEGTAFHGSEWFGVYSAEFFPWINHFELGWIYLTAQAQNSVALQTFMDGVGVVWTHPDYYPLLYQYATGHWLYYYPGSGTFGRGAWFYNYATQSHFQTPL